MGRLYCSMSNDERAVIDLMCSYVDSFLTEGEEVELDPTPRDIAGEQYHLYYHCADAKYSTMVGWFRVDEKFVNLTTFNNLWHATEQYDPGADTTKLVYHKFDMSNPNIDSLRQTLRCEFDKARESLQREENSGKR